MPGNQFSERKNYLSIVQGTLRQSVPFTENKDGSMTCDVPGAQRRDYVLKSGTPEEVKGTKFELIFMDWTGRIKDLVLKDGQYGETFDIVFDDATLRIATDSRYFDDFMMKLPNVKINQTITIHPYDFESDGVRRTGISIEQNGEKVKSYYWDGEKNVNGIPETKPNAKATYKKADWTMFFLTRRMFLRETVPAIVAMIEKQDLSVEEDFEPLEAPQEEVKDEEINWDDVKKKPKKEKTASAKQLDEVPF